MAFITDQVWNTLSVHVNDRSVSVVIRGIHDNHNKKLIIEAQLLTNMKIFGASIPVGICLK